MLHKNVECYVDDVVVKTKKRSDHLKDLRVMFKRLRKYNLKMNPLKCAFGVTSGKFLGFIVKDRGIKVDQSKIKAIQSMLEPRNLHELKSLQGWLAFIRRFISNLVGRCQPFSRLMKKDVLFVWDKACNNAFESIKKYLSSPLVLGYLYQGNRSYCTSLLRKDQLEHSWHRKTNLRKNKRSTTSVERLPALS
ncbi:hypothetical protein ACFX2G_013568 [Malus domestica]